MSNINMSNINMSNINNKINIDIDIAAEMRRNLRPVLLSNELRIKEALHHLDCAAERFDEAGNDKMAEMVTDLLVKMAEPSISSSPSPAAKVQDQVIEWCVKYDEHMPNTCKSVMNAVSDFEKDKSYESLSKACDKLIKISVDLEFRAKKLEFNKAYSLAKIFDNASKELFDNIVKNLSAIAYGKQRYASAKE